MVDDFDDWYGELRPRLATALAAWCGDRSVAADAVDEAFVRALERWDRVRLLALADAPAGWVWRTAANQARRFARSQRRATKHASDLLDVYRLVDRYQPPGQLITALKNAPGKISPVIATVVRDDYLANPGAAARSMESTQGTRISTQDVAETMAAFVEDLELDT